MTKQGNAGKTKWVCIGNGQMCNITMQEIANALDCMHDQQAVMLLGEENMEEDKLLANIGGDETAGAIDAHYYKGPGERAGTEREVVAVEPTYMSDRKGHNGVTTDGKATTLTAQEKERPLVGASVVRRLTPKECERLQQFPDDWSRWGINDKGETYELSDSARYRLQGNSIARPYWTWLMRRIAAQYEADITMGGLFEGQGGFVLCALQCGIKPLWSSEIEPHAVAVLRRHFGDEDMGIKGDWREYL